MKLKVALFCSMFSASLTADEMPEYQSIYDLTLEELLQVSKITASSGYEQDLQRAASNATVIAREEWQAMGAYTLADALRAVPGLHITKPKIDFEHNHFSIRGLSGSYGEQVKLLIDGQAIEDMQDSGMYAGFHMPIGMFKRIEVIKGPGSAIYGADAFAGIINLVGYTGEEMPSSISARSGRFGSQSLSGQKAFTLAEQQFGFAFDYIRSDDDPDRIVHTDLQSTFDQIFNTNVSSAPGAIDEHYEILSLSGQWQWQDWSLNYHTWRNFDVGIGAGIGQSLDNRGYSSAKTDLITLNWDLSGLFSVDSLNLTGHYKSHDSTSKLYIFPAGTKLPVGSDGNLNFVEPVGITLFSDGLIGTPSTSGNTRNLKLTQMFTIDQQQIRWEIGVETQDFYPRESKNFGPSILDGSQAVVDGQLTDVTGTDFIYIPDTSRNFYYLSLLDEWQLDDSVLLTLGIRYDKYSDFGSTTNPRLSLLYDVGDSEQQALTLKLFAGSAFRAPSFANLYSQNNPVGQGNLDLGPEGVNTFETGAGFDYLLDENLFIGLSLFYYRADDLIQLVLDPEQNLSINQNIGEQTGTGGELSLRWKPQNNITINFNYSLLDGEDNSGNTIADVPEHMAYLSMNWGINDNWNWFIDGKWVAGRKRGTTDTRANMDDYHQLNTRLVRNNLLPGLGVALLVKNLLNEDAREPSNGSIAEDYPLQGRQWLVELSYTF